MLHDWQRRVTKTPTRVAAMGMDIFVRPTIGGMTTVAAFNIIIFMSVVITRCVLGQLGEAGRVLGARVVWDRVVGDRVAAREIVEVAGTEVWR